MFKQIQIFLRICLFSNLLRKTNYLRFSVIFSAIVTFWSKKRSYLEFIRKCFKTTEKYSLAVCGSLWGGKKQFLLIFVPFYWFDQKQLIKQILIFLRISHFTKLLRKTNFLSISVLFSETANFWTKKRRSLWISPKMLQNNKKKHSVALCGSLWGEKQFLLIFSPVYGLIKNRCLNKSKFSSGFAPFQTC